MLQIKKILHQIENNVDEVISLESQLGQDLWNILLEQHPADIALLISRLDAEKQQTLFIRLPELIENKVFCKMPSNVQADLLAHIGIEHATILLKNMPADDLTDLFDHLSDEDLEKYLRLLQINQRKQILSLLNFNPRSAGGRMNSDVLTFQKNFTVKRSIEIIQRLAPKMAITRIIYITDDRNMLVGYIPLEKLVLSRPDTTLSAITLKNELIVSVDDDQEDVAYQMQHYELSSVPVVDVQNHFLGVITAEDVFDILEEEEGEDIYKRFGLVPSEEYSYFSTPLQTVVWQRGIWLVGLLILQSVSSLIIAQYQGLVNQFTIIAVFLTMLTGTGGNAGNQSATVVIRGLSTREVSRNNAWRVLSREFFISLLMASILVTVGFIRVYWTTGDVWGAIAINIALFLITLTSMMLGAAIPLILERFNIDPVHSAAPFLSTLMDVVGVLILFLVCSKILG